jgi:hypothetical protein
MTTVIIKTTSSGGKVKITTPAAIVLTEAEKAMVLAATVIDPMAALVAAVTVPLITDETVVVIDPMAAARAIFAAGLADVQKTSDRWTTDYAQTMNENMPEAWWTLAHNDESPEGLRVRREQKAAYAALKTAGYTNPSVAWKRVRTAAAKLAGWIDAETEEAEEGEEGEEGSAKASPYVKIQELLAAAIKKLSKLDADHSGEMKVLADCAKRLPSL